MEISAQQFIHFFAAIMLLLCFAMLTQRRMLNLIRLLALQGLVLSIDVAFVAYEEMEHELYFTVILTLVLKVWMVPHILHKMLTRLNIKNKMETMGNLITILLIGLGLVVFAFILSIRIAQLSQSTLPTMLALGLASVLICSFMMIVKTKAISQVVSLLALENSLFFVAISSAHSMPLVVELGIAFDVLVALFIIGIFFFRIREKYESFDLKHLEKLRED